MSLFDALSNFLRAGQPVPPFKPQQETPTPSDEAAGQVELVAAMAQRMADVINESMQIANRSKNVETRRSRIRVARDRLVELQKLDSDYSFLALTNLVNVERSIAELERETDAMDRPQPEGWKIGNPGARHPYAIGPDHPASQYCAGMRFSATFQTRTPLRILRRHGQVLPIGADLPEDFEPWMGMWVPQAKSSAMREAAGEKSDGEIASSAGPVRPSEYLPFLIAVREAVEDLSDGTSGRMARLHEACAQPAFARFVAAEGGAARMCDRFFPPVLSLIRGLPSTSRQALAKLGITSVAKLRGATDSALLTIKGIGPGKLVAIRAFCASYTGDPDAERTVDLAL